MAIKITEPDIADLREQAQQQGEQTYQITEFGGQYNLSKQFGEGCDRLIQLRGGLTIYIRNNQFWQSLNIERQHGEIFPVTAKFCLSGGSRVKTSHVPEIKAEYEEVTGCNYLYHLPNLIEVEEWQANISNQVVMIYANIDYFRALNPTGEALPRPLQRLMQGRERFHQPLGKMTPAMKQVLEQILYCPYQGSAQQLYLESKALELLALQFACLDADLPASKSCKLKPGDLERVQYAREILVKRVCNPLSLVELARQVELNECTLKQGFREVFGTTVFGYLRDYRMHQAQMLLRSPDLTIAQVAAQVGYRNPEAFSTAFRRKFAINPKAYQMGQRR
jgi:AraC-like DNA-binding protein